MKGNGGSMKDDIGMKIDTVREALETAKRLNEGLFIYYDKAVATLSTLYSKIEPTESAKDLATRLFDGVALRVDQFFKAKNIQGGVKSAQDMFSAVDALELAKSIERYAQGRFEIIRLECAEKAMKYVTENGAYPPEPWEELRSAIISDLEQEVHNV